MSGARGRKGGAGASAGHAALGPAPYPAALGIWPSAPRPLPPPPCVPRRFLVQNVLRWESEGGRRFEPLAVDVGAATNVLDRWICAASRSLTAFVREEMEAYRWGPGLRRRRASCWWLPLNRCLFHAGPPVALPLILVCLTNLPHALAPLTAPHPPTHPPPNPHPPTPQPPRLYTVVPYLVRFIDSLTNVYVRYNRKRLKGAKGPEDCALALASLFDVLLTVCKVMAPFTPFFTGERARRALAWRWPAP